MVGHFQKNKQKRSKKSGLKREQDTYIPCRSGAPGTGDDAKSPPRWGRLIGDQATKLSLSLRARRGRPRRHAHTSHRPTPRSPAVDRFGGRFLGVCAKHTARQSALKARRSPKIVVRLCMESKERVLKAVRQYWEALKDVDEVWRTDREVVLTAVQHDGRALRFAAEALK
eukprot:5020612-Amphidinium_carterae.1